ncbi:hypothetical protein BHE97_07955 [Aeromicrobium sp. PE09-221]|uniref:hypothetical protein n=1 Tax=Aeromicrobium sp. PE09-221 TaxID=1898043 RepID=UPI000B3E6270|nr:hypothetical protein [Aeromicrobium sp. PE09-221]OUZ10276.1 hypothetical protein BHE97_07955 [Aeromicrobium sp. PE09-221]
MSAWDEMQQREQDRTAAIRDAIGDQIDVVVAEYEFGSAPAVKRGRNPQWPYVPILKSIDEHGRASTRQVQGLAYATREEAVDRAERYIAEWREKMRADLANPRHRAWREHLGLPRDPLSTDSEHSADGGRDE